MVLKSRSGLSARFGADGGVEYARREILIDLGLELWAVFAEGVAAGAVLTHSRGYIVQVNAGLAGVVRLSDDAVQQCPFARSLGGFRGRRAPGHAHGLRLHRAEERFERLFDRHGHQREVVPEKRSGQLPKQALR